MDVLHAAGELVCQVPAGQMDVLKVAAAGRISAGPKLVAGDPDRAADPDPTRAGRRVEGGSYERPHVTAAMYRSFVAAMPDGPVITMYGNTFGNALALPVLDQGGLIPYMSMYPQVTHAVVDPEDWTRLVEYGRTGQVRLTVLHDDLLLPNILERDSAVRHDAGADWPWDAVANVRPLQGPRAIPEGTY
ncbi:hypothetical protein [Streptomyces sp. ME19-01-6]|uniref:hypothetical protein n=1 Tax=Streptomyces sp. ME19-01-6 TaxID=3028686 RepID=UPI0029AAB03B|nr:hypothetical protein [Streptomyces sp. ME19-01-6]MDX3233700.1 hypothetical protein [Streptomyces sp. ME19-01-6]